MPVPTAIFCNSDTSYKVMKILSCACYWQQTPSGKAFMTPLTDPT